MARFVAKYAGYVHGVRSEVLEHYATGQSKVLVRGLEATFNTRGLTDFEVEVGLTKLAHLGLAEDRDTEEHVSARSRLSLFDSEAASLENGWTDEEHDLVVRALRSSSENGLAYLEVETPRRPAPWSAYDSVTDVDRIIELIEATGSDPAYVAAYERENANRPEVLEAIEALGVDSSADEVVIEA